MDVRRPTAEGAPVLGESRTRVLGALQSAGEPLGVGEVAKRVRLHTNTARFHLDGLVEAGLAERRTEDRDRPGRPRKLYTARPDAGRAGTRNYHLLADILAGYLAAETPQPARAAREAGKAWGRYLATSPPPYRRVDVDTAIEQLVGTMSDIGFDPEAVESESERHVLLHHCPFRETAEEHREVVCSIHLGLMQGLLAAIDAPIAAERLDPFVKPDLCVGHLTGSGRSSRTRDV